MPNGRLKLILLLLATAALAVLIALHMDGINGPSYWRWPWRVRRGIGPYLMLLAAAVPLAVAEVHFSSRAALPGILLMMATTLGLEIVNRASDLATFDLTRLATIIEEPGSIGYFTHAEEFVQSGRSVREFLGDYVSLMPGFTLHARNKPPGSILFYVPFVRWSATENGAALAAGICIALLATFSVPAVWWVTRELTGDRAAAYQAAACMALCPGLVLFLPEFDQFYPIYSCALIVLWTKAIKTGRPVYAVAFGLLLALVCFQTFNLLVLGIFLIGYAITLSPCHPVARSFRQSLLIVAVLFATYALLWLWSGYNPIQTLLTGIKLHQRDMPATHRSWPLTVPFDLTDFALGTGWVCVLPAVYYLLGSARRDGRVSLTLLCFAQLVAVAVSGLLAGETARVWIFMFPLLLIPAGLELAAWPAGRRMAALACLWLLTAMLSQNMVFV